MAEIGSSERETTGTREKERRDEKWATVAPKRTQKRWEEVGHSCLLFSKAGLEHLYVESEFVAIQCTLRR